MLGIFHRIHLAERPGRRFTSLQGEGDESYCSNRRHSDDRTYSYYEIQGAHRFLQAMIEMVLVQGALGVADCLLDGIQLLGDVETGYARLEYGGDTPQMAFARLRRLAECVSCRCSLMKISHPLEGICQSAFLFPPRNRAIASAMKFGVGDTSDPLKAFRDLVTPISF